MAQVGNCARVSELFERLDDVDVYGESAPE